MGEPRWVHFRDWSGVGIRGDNRYTCPSPPAPADVVVAAVTKPEGSSYDAVTTYDGTAVTWGLAQWTFTSGRLQHLLAQIYNKLGSEAPVLKPLQVLLTQMGLTMDPASRELRDLRGREVSTKDALRNLFTPPGGAVPKTGSRWVLAKNIASVFHQLGKDPTVAKIQVEFFLNELHREEILPRPKLDTRAICYYLGRVTDLGTPVQIAARALMWSTWQNSPRQAETLLSQALHGFEEPLKSQAGLDRLAKRIGYSSYARWGVTKAREAKDAAGKPAPYMSRYEKMASEINNVMGRVLVPELWK